MTSICQYIENIRHSAMYFMIFKFNLHKIIKVFVVFFYTEKESGHRKAKSFAIGHLVTEF